MIPIYNVCYTIFTITPDKTIHFPYTNYIVLYILVKNSSLVTLQQCSLIFFVSIYNFPILVVKQKKITTF